MIRVGVSVGSFSASGGGFDADAQAFFDRVTTAGGSLTTTEKNATNQLVLDMKSAGIWSSMKAVYPMVGASAAACAQNLKSSSFTGTFNGGWTFASTGVTPNGTNANMATGLTPSTSLSTSSAHLSFYSRTNINQATYDVSASQHYSLLLYANTFYVNLETSGQYNATQSITNTTGYYIATRVNNTNVNGYRNGTKTINNVAQNSTLATSQIYLSAANNIYYSTKQCAFASIGDGLTDTQALNFDTAVQAFQTTLSRQI